MKISLSRLARSTAFFLRCQLSKKEVDVLFYYSAYYCKERGYNPYFDPLAQACEEAGLSYIILEEPHPPYENRNSSNVVPADLFFFLSIFLRKTLFAGVEDISTREWKIGRIIKKSLFRKIRAKNFITISQSVVGIARGMDGSMHIYDLQHGVLFSNHESVFDAPKKIAGHITLNRIRLFLYGEGFKKILCDADPSGYYRQNSIVIGHPFWPYRKRPDKEKKKIVAVSMQFMNFFGECDRCNKAMLESLEKIVAALKPALDKEELQLALKHHPRFEGEVYIGSLLQNRGVFLYEGESPKILEKAFLHLTFSSTTIFEAAALGTPTLLIECVQSYLPSDIYTNEFGYPLHALSAEEAAEKILELNSDNKTLETLSRKVLEWSHSFYEPFSPERFIKEIKEKGKC